jgi:uncharacterized protein
MSKKRKGKNSQIKDSSPYYKVTKSKLEEIIPTNLSVSDGFTNETLGLGQGVNNLFSDSQYSKTNTISWDRETLDSAYRQNWIVGKVVDLVAEDATREWITITGDYTPEQITSIEKEAEKLKIRDSIRSAIKWGRLYGGAGAIILIDGESLSSPLNLDLVRPNSFKGLYVLDRWTLWPSINTPISSPGPDFGYPQYYRIGTGQTNNSSLLDRTVVHSSRLSRFIGIELPYWQRFQDLWWGESVIERMYDRLCAFDNVTFSLVNLVFKAQLRIFRLEGYRKLIAKGGEGVETFQNFIEECRKYQNSDGITVLDEADQFMTFNPTYAGLKDIMLICGEQVGGAADIPYMILFGRSQTGIFMGSDQDTKSYYAKISSFQESSLRESITSVYKVMIKSMGLDPQSFDFEFKTLWKVTPAEAAKMAAQDVAAVVTAFDAGLISRATALAELRESSLYHNRWTTVSVEMINQAADIPLPRPEREGKGPVELKRDLELSEIQDNIKLILSSLPGYTNNDDTSTTSSSQEVQNAKSAHRESVDPGSRQANVAKQKLGSPRVRL